MNQEVFSDLVLQSQSGDANALEQLLVQAYSPVFNLTHKILHNHHTAEQVTRDTLEAVASNLASLQEANQFPQWLCRMTAARCMQASPLLHRNFAEADLPAYWEDSLTDGTVLSEEESADAILSMVDCLPESQRLCILLLGCGSLPIPAIAQLTGFSETSIKQNIRHGQHTIQQHLWELDGRGIQFSGVSSLTDILHESIFRDADEQAAMVMVYDILGKKLPVPPSVWVVRLLTVIVIVLLIAVLGLAGVIGFKLIASMLG